MKTRHLNELLARLELVPDLGFVVIRKEELKTWYNVERVGRAVYADILDKWQNEMEQDQPLLVGGTPAEYVFIWGQGLKTETDAWFRDVSDLSKKKLEKPASTEDVAEDVFS